MDLKLPKMLCKDSKQHHVMFHELNSVSSLLCIAQNVRFEIPYKDLYFETPFFNDIQILCLGFLWAHRLSSQLFAAVSTPNIAELVHFVFFCLQPWFLRRSEHILTGKTPAFSC